ncbi:Coagulation factor XI [Channa argus]|uniref:Coagulation factor XI n=1 Tax=Channa argus TaxID=215402 RepID=A0A6G1QYS6_CHAAH|nr:Coagulation factor XI [Channa argus]
MPLCFSNLSFLCRTPAKKDKMSSHLVLVVLFSLCSLSFSQDCTPEVLENVDFPGGDISFLYSPDVTHCQLLCTQDPSCLFFTFVRADWTQDNRNFQCLFKSSPSGKPSQQIPIQGATSGFSLKFCNQESEPCLSEVYQNVDFLGADYRAVFTPDFEECQRACTQDPLCQFFTFVNEAFVTPTIRYKCHLKYSGTVARTGDIERKTGVISGFSSSIQTSKFFQPACQGKLLPSSDIPGNDFVTLPASSPEHCLALCSAHPSCTFFSFESNNFNCNLKNNPNELVTIPKQGFTSGIPAHFCQLDNSWLEVALEGVDFLGSDVRPEPMDDADTCQKTCTEDRNCQFYTFTTETFPFQDFRNICFLKRSITLPAPPKVNKLDNVVSGFSLRSCSI